MSTFRWLEDLDRRVLGAVRFVSDVDASPIAGPLEVSVASGHAADPGVVLSIRIQRNRFGLHILQSAPGFESYTAAFIPDPTAPPIESRVVYLRVNDPSGRFLPAEFSVRLPRALPGVSAAAARITSPVDVRLLPSPATPLADGWAVLRALVWREVSPGSFLPLRGALLRVLRQVDGAAIEDLEQLGCGLTEWRPWPDGSRPAAAEALVAVPGIPVTQWNPSAGGPVVSTGQAIRLELRYAPAFDPALPGAIPDLAALNAAAPSALVVRAALPAGESLQLQARERRTLPLLLTLGGALQLSQPS